MNNLPKLTRIIVFIVVCLLLLQVMAANRLTTAGLKLTDLEKQKESLSEENDYLERKIATFSSLTRIAQKAAEDGFAKAQTLYLTPELPVAFGNLNGMAR